MAIKIQIRTVRGLAALLAWGVALGASAGCLDDSECVPGASRCEGDHAMSCIHECSDIVCRDYWAVDVCQADRVCVIPDGQRAMCLDSAEPDPACGTEAAASYCNGDSVVSCVAGYRTKRTACGATDEFHQSLLPGGPAATHCMEANPGAATCVPPESAVDPLCGGATGPQCSGALLVQCVAGLAVAKTECASCTIDGSDPLGPIAQCHGFLGDGCARDADCASGLSCLADHRGLLLCTVSCDGVMSAPEENIPPPNPGCLDTFRAGGPAPSGYVRVPVAGNVLACVAARCEWLLR